jgi:glycosyltransferase involved in cell wall biosynthesis
MSEVVEGLVSTIIPVYNRPQMLREAVDSVLAQTYRPIEIIIADDGSTDEAGREADRMVAEHPGVIQVIHRPHQGPGPAREAGRLLARGEFIQYLDSDDRLIPRKFEWQVNALRQCPDCGAAYGYIQRYGETELNRVPLKWSGRELPTLFPWLLVDRWWNTDCPLFRRTVCDAVGPWSDLRYSQDWEYDARVGALGTRLVHVKEFVCEYRQHGGERQTGSGRWLAPPDRVRFFRSMFQQARMAGVELNGREMRHFARWVFLHARQCGEAGDAASSRACLALAAEAAGGMRGDLWLYWVGAMALGWVSTARLTSWVIARTGRHPGAGTLALSSSSTGSSHA